MATLSSDSYLPTESPRRASPLFVSLVMATIALLIAGVVSVAALSGGTTNSPEDAVRALMQATASGDVTGALAAVDPNEADAIRPGLTAVVADLQKLGVLSSTLNLSDLAGLSATFDNVTMTSASVDASRSDLAAVTLTGGTVTTHVDVAQLALGTLLKNLLNGRVPASSHTATLGTPGSANTPIVTINRNGQWYVSIGYTLAEAARRHSGAAFPTAAQAIPASGGSSPEDAVRKFVAAAVQPDPTALIGLLNPTDTQALHDYGSLLVAHVPAAGTPRASVSSLDLTSSTVSDGTLVTATSFTATAGTTTVSLGSNGCLSITSSGATSPQPVCAPAGANLAGVGLLTVEQGGSWYVDPYRSVLDDLDHAIAGVNLGELTTLLGGLGQGGLLGGAGGGGAGGLFGALRLADPTGAMRTTALG